MTVGIPPVGQAHIWNSEKADILYQFTCLCLALGFPTQLLLICWGTPPTSFQSMLGFSRGSSKSASVSLFLVFSATDRDSAGDNSSGQGWVVAMSTAR